MIDKGIVLADQQEKFDKFKNEIYLKGIDSIASFVLEVYERGFGDGVTHIKDAHEKYLSLNN